MLEKNALVERHGFLNDAIFHVKAALLTARRHCQNRFSGRLQRFGETQQLATAPIIAAAVSDLWSADDNEANWILTAGKVQNLRIAIQRLNGVEVPAHAIFSFWRHVGRPAKRKGYVIGRELREGCLLPTIAGGLCQLSNALYDAALKAGFEVIERHRHSQVIPGSLAEQDRDATVKWNYVDLRFRADHPFRIEAVMNAEKLEIRFRADSHRLSTSIGKQKKMIPSANPNDCYSCGNTTCFQHSGDTPQARGTREITTYILDEIWPEYDAYLRGIASDDDRFIVPMVGQRLTRRYAWRVVHDRKKVKSFALAAIERGIALRLFAKSNGAVPATLLKYDRRIVRTIKRHLVVECTHLMIFQNLLPFAWKEGLLFGRTFDVLMTRLPMEHLHKRLDLACSVHPASRTLDDFRASNDLIRVENECLQHARRLITPHEEIASIYPHKTVKLAWHRPAIAGPACPGEKVLFPAAALGRKGAYEMQRLASELGLSLVVRGRPLEDPDFWKGLNIDAPREDLLDSVGLVIYPTYIEHQPRLLLKALARRIPVITTSACGLPPQENLVVVPIGDYEALVEAIRASTIALVR